MPGTITDLGSANHESRVTSNGLSLDLRDNDVNFYEYPVPNNRYPIIGMIVRSFGEVGSWWRVTGNSAENL